MSPDEIRVALETAVGVPEEAMQAAVQNPTALAPAVIAVAQSMANGRLPLPHEERLLRFGLHALAAARETSACQAFLRLLRRPSLETGWLFGEAASTAVAQLLLGLFNGDAESVAALVLDTTVDSEVRGGLMQALARLAWEGQVPRQRVLALLDQFDREALAPIDSWAWFGWQEAILLLGATEMIEQVQRGWEAGRLSDSFRDVDRRDWIEQTEKAAAQPDDEERFVTDHVTRIVDPAKSVEWSADAPSGPGEPLSGDELAWLDNALLRTVAERNVALEEADGFLTALAAGPVRVPPSEYLTEILQAEGEAAGFDSPEHKALVVEFLTRHHDGIERDLTAGKAIRPWVYDVGNDLRGALWGRGYLRGVTLRKAEWEPLVSVKRLASALVMPMLLLLPDPEQHGKSVLSPERRSLLIRALPEVALATKAFWTDGWHPLLDVPEPRTPKIGRNDPCPCGSGKKYKRCCGAAA